MQIKNLARWRPTPRICDRWLGINAARATGLSPALADMLQEVQERASVYAR